MDSNANVFEQATRRKLRFQVVNGSGASISVEDLWDLPLTSRTSRPNLDDVARLLHRQVKQTTEEVSFVEPTSNTANEELQLRFDIVKYIINVRVQEKRAESERADRAQKKQQLLEILSRKENAELEGKSVDELRTMINAL